VSTFLVGSPLESILSSVKRKTFGNKGNFNQNRGQFMKLESKLNLSEDRGKISNIEDSPLKNQSDGQSTLKAY